MSRIWDASPKKATELNPYEGPIFELSREDSIYFHDVYELGVTDRFGYIKRNETRYLLPILCPSGRVRGYVARQGWAGSPLEGESWGQKAYTYMHAAGPVQSFYDVHDYSTRCHASRSLVLVEDQLSAIKTALSGFRSCALLGMPVAASGSYSGADRIREIASLRPSEVIVAMDADATDKAFQFARSWGMAFNKCRVAILERDLKDEPLDDIREVLGL